MIFSYTYLSKRAVLINESDREAFNQLKARFNELYCGLDMELPVFWQTKPDEPYQLTTIFTVDAVINSFSTSPLNTSSHSFFSQMGDVIKDSIKNCLEAKRKPGWLPLPSSENRSAFFLFITELLHWSQTELKVYDEMSPTSLERLQARYDYLENCRRIENLIPATDRKNIDSSHPANTIQTIKQVIKRHIKNVTVLQRYRAFEHGLRKLTHIMETSHVKLLQAQ